MNPAQWTQSVAAGVGVGKQVGSATRSVVCTTKKGQCPNGVRTEIHPFMWSGSAASAVDLNQFLPPGYTDAAATGSVTLNGVAPAGGALVTLASDSPAATVPPSVVVPAGQTTATFGVKTNAVTTSVTATLAATYGSLLPATSTAQLIVSPAPTTQADTVAIQKAEYVASKRQLSVQSSSSSSSATLTVSAANGSVIGVLSNKGGGRYDGTFNVTVNPQSIVVSSNLNGSASRAVTLK